jgi:hypothetical protein
MRIRLSLDLDRSRRDEEPDFEHRDVDSVTENAYGGAPETHRMGFAPDPDYYERKAA